MGRNLAQPGVRCAGAAASEVFLHSSGISERAKDRSSGYAENRRDHRGPSYAGSHGVLVFTCGQRQCAFGEHEFAGGEHEFAGGEHEFAGGERVAKRQHGAEHREAG